MKKLLIMSSLLAGFITAKGQASAGMIHNKWEENDNRRFHKTRAVAVNEFADVEISVTKGIVYFSGLPDVTKPVYAIITNADGEYIRQARITEQQNTMNIRSLRKGLYFVTIMYKGESKKAFTVNQ